MSILDRFRDLIRIRTQRNEDLSPGQTSSCPAADLAELKVVELRAEAKNRGLKGYTKLRKAELLALLSE